MTAATFFISRLAAVGWISGVSRQAFLGPEIVAMPIGRVAAE